MSAASRRRRRWRIVVGAAARAAGDLVQGGAAIPLDSLARFEVRVVNGQTLLTIPNGPHPLVRGRSRLRCPRSSAHPPARCLPFE